MSNSSRITHLTDRLTFELIGALYDTGALDQLGHERLAALAEAASVHTSGAVLSFAAEAQHAWEHAAPADEIDLLDLAAGNDSGEISWVHLEDLDTLEMVAAAQDDGRLFDVDGYQAELRRLRVELSDLTIEEAA